MIRSSSLLALCLGLTLAVPVSARPVAAQEAPELPPRLQQARERWDELSPKDRQRVRANYRRWKAMSEEQRKELRHRAQRLKREREEVERQLPPDVKHDLAQLDSRKQRQVLHDLAEARVKESGRRIRSKMPRDFVKRLEQAPPAERPELLRKFKRTQRGRVSHAAVELLGRQLQLPPAEIHELQALPEDQRARAVLELRQRLTERNLPEGGLPHGLTWEQWDEWSDLSPTEFFARIVEFRERRVDSLAERRSARGPGTVQRGPVGPNTGRPGRSPEARPRPDPARVARRDAPLPRVLKRLAEAVNPDPRDALELIELSRPERKEGMARRRRHRCMQLILGEHLLPEKRVRELEQLSNEEFFDLVRQILVHTGHIETPVGGEDG